VFHAAGPNPDVLQIAVGRFTQRLAGRLPAAVSSSACTAAALSSCAVVIETADTTLSLGNNESYHLFVGDGAATIRAPTVWGALYGMETFVQHVYSKTTGGGARVVASTPLTVQDAPRFAHRGLLLDTSRHFLPQPLLLKAVDALAMNKLNVLHWHLVDAESFPLRPGPVPQLANGAFSPAMVYTEAQIREVVQHGKERGVRVLPGGLRVWHAVARLWGGTCPGLPWTTPK
jgi:hexosaminidase